MKDAAAIARFEREGRAGQANGVHFLVMEDIQGQDLSALVKQNGPFPVTKANNYVLQAARGLELAHSVKGSFVHRDIKPTNLLWDIKGVVKILDMGSAGLSNSLSNPWCGRWLAIARSATFARQGSGL